MRPPRFWFTPPHAPGFFARLYQPFTYFWRFVTRQRLARGAWERLSAPVICVGNVNLGGTGKTPVVIEILTRLTAGGHAPHVVSRGHGGSLQGPVQVIEQAHTADEVGDEPLLLAAFAPTWVAKDRAAGAKAAIAAGANVIVLDDGLQNPALTKDLTLLVVDALTAFGNGLVVPSGPLRETVDQGLKRTDIVVAIGGPQDQDALLKTWPQLSQKPILSAAIKPLKTGMEWKGLRVLAFAGIGRPEKFFQSLREARVDLVQTRSFDDHQKLPLALLQRLETEAAVFGAQLVTTEKDSVRLPASFKAKVLTFPVRLSVKNGDELDRALARLFE